MASAIITVLALGIVSVVVMTMTRRSTNSNTQQQNQSVTFSGSLACLPYNTQPGTVHTDECAIGLKTDDGRYYTLQNLPQNAAMTPFTKHVTVSGTLTSQTDDRYSTRGVIAVSNFTVQQ